MPNSIYSVLDKLHSQGQEYEQKFKDTMVKYLDVKTISDAKKEMVDLISPGSYDTLTPEQVLEHQANYCRYILASDAEGEELEKEIKDTEKQLVTSIDDASSSSLIIDSWDDLTKQEHFKDILVARPNFSNSQQLVIDMTRPKIKSEEKAAASNAIDEYFSKTPGVQNISLAKIDGRWTCIPLSYPTNLGKEESKERLLAGNYEKIEDLNVINEALTQRPREISSVLIQNNGHWTGLVIDPVNQNYRYLDSYASEIPPPLKTAVEATLSTTGKYTMLPGITTSQQKDAQSCGYFLISNMKKIAQFGIKTDLSHNTQSYIDQTVRPRILDSLYEKTFKQLQNGRVSKRLSNEIQKTLSELEVSPKKRRKRAILPKRTSQNMSRF